MMINYPLYRVSDARHANICKYINYQTGVLSSVRPVVRLKRLVSSSLFNYLRAPPGSFGHYENLPMADRLYKYFVGGLSDFVYGSTQDPARFPSREKYFMANKNDKNICNEWGCTFTNIYSVSFKRKSKKIFNTMANSLKSKIDKLFAAYKKRIVENPQLVSEVEVAVKWLSYFSVGHFNNSNLALEIIYSMPNLIMLSNDMLMYHSSSLHPKIPQYESKIKIWLTVLEYTQTLLEATGKKLGGEMGRWIIIAVVQFSKAILRLLLIYVYKDRITKNPSVPPLNRKIFNKASGNLQSKEGFRLKRSGVVVRAIKYAEPVQLRTWKALPCDADENQNVNNNYWSDINLKLAESLYVIKPLIYLGCISVTSQHHWQPWILSLLVDSTSLYTFARCSQSTVFTKEENVELISRKISLLLYILKSPFYEKYGRAKINTLLDRISASVPLTNLLVNSLKRNLEYINSMYFYTS